MLHFLLLLIVCCLSAEQVVVESYPNGNPEKIICYCDTKPIRELVFSECGFLQEESDIIEDQDGELVFHGFSTHFYPSGSIKEIIPYFSGVIQGEWRSFSEDNILQSRVFYKNSCRDGPYAIMSPLGHLYEEGNYVNDKLSGEVVRYHLDGSRAYQGYFQEGVLNGEEFLWDERNRLRSHANYRLGLLHSQPTQVALTRYYENGKKQEILDCAYGLARNCHIKNHENGQIAYRCPYVNGKKHGIEESFSEGGVCFSSCKFAKGKPCGEFLKKHENGSPAIAAKYSEQGKLLKPIQEFDEAGKKLCEYCLENGRYQGEYLEYFPNGKIKTRYTFADDEFDGIQWEFFDNEKPSLRCEYAKGVRHGAYHSWYKDGIAAKEIHYDKGKLQGSYLTWHENGKPKLEAAYHKGYLDGTVSQWDEKGTLLKEMQYRNGVLHGTATEWSSDGVLLSEVEYDEGVPSGTVKNREVRDKSMPNCHTTYGSNGQILMDAHYLNGILEGPCTTYFEDGTLQKEEMFSEGKPVGLHREYYPNPNGGVSTLSKTSIYLDGKPHGEFAYFYPNGKKQAIIGYRDGLLHGRKAFWDSNDCLVEHAFYQHGKLEGRYFLRREDGSELICNYRNNRLEGPYLLSHRKVKLCEACYKNGILDGEKVEFNEMGNKISSVTYREGLRHGPAVFYSENGQVTAYYENDKPNGPWMESSLEGRILRCVTYKDGAKEGDQKEYFTDGHLKVLTPFKKGNIHGCLREWNEEGELCFECEYYQGKKQGRLVKYAKGSPKREFNFQNDRLIR